MSFPKISESTSIRQECFFWRGRASVTAAAALGPYKKLRKTRRSSTSTNYGKQIARKKRETET